MYSTIGLRISKEKTIQREKTSKRACCILNKCPSCWSVARNFTRGCLPGENLSALRIIFQPCNPLQPFFLQGVCSGTLCTPPDYAPAFFSSIDDKVWQKNYFHLSSERTVLVYSSLLNSFFEFKMSICTL